MNSVRKPLFFGLIAVAVAAFWGRPRHERPAAPEREVVEHGERIDPSTQAAPSTSEEAPEVNRNGRTDGSPEETVVEVKNETLRAEPSESLAAGGYIRLAEIPLAAEERAYRIRFESPLGDYLSLVFVGGGGHSHLKDITVQYEDGRRVRADHLNGDYFAEDWYRLEASEKASDNKIVAITFTGRGKTEDARFSVMLQKTY